MKTIDFTTTIKVKRDDLESLIISAIEGGSNYWYRIESDTEGNYLETAFTAKGLVISDFVGVDGIEKHMVKGVLNPDSMRNGLALMAKEYPQHFADLMSDNADALTGDVFLQLTILGKLIYG